MEEIWKDIAGYEGLYQVSNLGRVKSVERTVIKGNGRMAPHFIKEKILKTFVSNSGYERVNLYNSEKKKKHYSVHRLVAFAFPEICGEYFDGAEANHINQIKTDNRAENLEWVDKKTNMNYKDRVGRASSKCWKPVAQLSKDGELISVFLSIKSAAEKTGANKTCISACCNGKLDHTHGFKWKFIK